MEVFDQRLFATGLALIVIGGLFLVGSGYVFLNAYFKRRSRFLRDMAKVRNSEDKEE